MKTRYYEYKPILKEALCDNCGETLSYTRTDFKRGALAWLHKCNRCGKYYWLDNRYPCTDYIVDTSRPLDIATDPISGEEAK